MDECELIQLRALLKPPADLEKVEIAKSALGELLSYKAAWDGTCEVCHLLFGLFLGVIVGALGMHAYDQFKF